MPEIQDHAAALVDLAAQLREAQTRTVDARHALQVAEHQERTLMSRLRGARLALDEELLKVCPR